MNRTQGRPLALPGLLLGKAQLRVFWLFADVYCIIVV